MINVGFKVINVAASRLDAQTSCGSANADSAGDPAPPWITKIPKRPHGTAKTSFERSKSTPERRSHKKKP
jgi:hypothetical protein